MEGRTVSVKIPAERYNQYKALADRLEVPLSVTVEMLMSVGYDRLLKTRTTPDPDDK